MLKYSMSKIVFTFGRMNPPTKGHERLVSTVVETAKQIGGDHIVFLSQTQNDSTDPLDWKFKTRICEASFPGVKISKNSQIRTPFQALEEFIGLYEEVTLVVGEDQVQEFAQRMAPYAMQWGFRGFDVVSAGRRIDESEGIEGMSASKLRKYAVDGNKDLFLEGLPSNLPKGAKNLVYEKVRKAIKKTR